MKTPALSDTLPSLIKERQIETAEFTDTMTAFLDEYFRGLFDCETVGLPEGYLFTSAAGVAFFFREVFRALSGRRMLHISWIHEEKRFLIRLSFFSGAAFASLGFSLQRAAAASGFRASLGQEGDKTVLTLEFRKSTVFSYHIYNPTRSTLYSEIFHTFFGDIPCPVSELQ